MEESLKNIEENRIASSKIKKEHKFYVFKNHFLKEAIGFVYESELKDLFSSRNLKTLPKNSAPVIPFMLDNAGKKIIEGSVFSGFIIFDIDKKENDNIKDIYNSSIHNIYTYFVSFSKSKGLSIIVKASILNEHYNSANGFKQAYNGIAEEYINSLGVDFIYDKGAMKRSQLRYINYNPINWLFQNLDSEVLYYSKPLEEEKLTTTSVFLRPTIAQSQGMERWLLNYLTNEIVSCSSCHDTVLNKSIFAGGYIIGFNMDENTIFNHILGLYRQKRPTRSISNMTKTIWQGIEEGKKKPIYNFRGQTNGY